MVAAGKGHVPGYQALAGPTTIPVFLHERCRRRRSCCNGLALSTAFPSKHPREFWRQKRTPVGSPEAIPSWGSLKELLRLMRLSQQSTEGRLPVHTQVCTHPRRPTQSPLPPACSAPWEAKPSLLLNSLVQSRRPSPTPCLQCQKGEGICSRVAADLRKTQVTFSQWLSGGSLTYAWAGEENTQHLPMKSLL